MYDFVINRENGDVKITIHLISSYGEKPKFWVKDVATRERGKRKWNSIGVIQRDTYSYRKLDYNLREKYTKETVLKYCTMEEIEKAIDCYLESIRPTFDDVHFSFE